MRGDLTRLFLLARVSDVSKLGTPAGARTCAARITELLVISKYRRVLSGANLFDNIWWFNKEMCDDSINMIELLMLMNAKSSAVPNVLQLFKALRASKLKAAYKCELFAKAFEPVAGKKSATKKAKATKKDAPKKASTKSGKPSKKK